MVESNYITKKNYMHKSFFCEVGIWKEVLIVMLLYNFFTMIFLTFIFSTATLKHVAKTVAHLDLSDHVIDVVFTLFDENCEYDSLQYHNQNITLHA